MTDEQYITICKRIMAQGYTIQELVTDINRHLNTRQVTEQQLIDFIGYKGSIERDIERALFKMFNINCKKSSKLVVPRINPKDHVSVMKGNKESILNKLRLSHGPEYVNDIDKKINVIIGAAISYGEKKAMSNIKRKSIDGV